MLKVYSNKDEKIRSVNTIFDMTTCIKICEVDF